jgi:hypothetical protein
MELCISPLRRRYPVYFVSVNRPYLPKGLPNQLNFQYVSKAKAPVNVDLNPPNHYPIHKSTLINQVVVRPLFTLDSLKRYVSHFDPFLLHQIIFFHVYNLTIPDGIGLPLPAAEATRQRIRQFVSKLKFTNLTY